MSELLEDLKKAAQGVQNSLVRSITIHFSDQLSNIQAHYLATGMGNAYARMRVSHVLALLCCCSDSHHDQRRGSLRHLLRNLLCHAGLSDVVLQRLRGRGSEKINQASFLHPTNLLFFLVLFRTYLIVLHFLL